MKNLLIFLFGAGCGFGGAMLWLRKSIKDELSTMNENKENAAEAEMPFTVEENKPKAVRKESRVAYHKIINDVKDGVKPPADIPILPREDEPKEDEEDDTDGGIYEIDRDEFDHDRSYEKERLVYYEGDRVMATEGGTVIANPYLLVGGNWEVCVGNYMQHTALIRNSKLCTDYEIYVEEGLYTDEYGIENNYKED